MPKTAGDDDAFKVNDPARVSHFRFGNQYDTLAGSGSLLMPGPRVFGATPLDHVDRKLAPARGASPHDETKGYCPTPLA